MTLYQSPHTIWVDGIALPGNLTSKERVEEIKNMETTEKDIILTGYPRCGSTFMLELLYLLQTDGDFVGANTINQVEKRAFMEMTTNSLDPNDKDSFVKATAKLGEKRLLKTHMSAQHLLKPIEDGKSQIFIVVRNVKDCLVSYYEFHKRHIHLAPDFNCTFSEFLEIHAAKKMMFGDWLEFNEGFWKLKDKPNVHFIFYEKAIRDLKGTIRQVAHILGKSITDEMVDKINEHCSFNSMKENKTLHISYLKDTFIRQGKVGNWKKIFTVEQSDRIDEMYSENIASLGLPIEYS